MATVRITKDLKETIIQALKSKFKVRRDAIKQRFEREFEPLTAQYAEDLLTAILAKNNMPREIYDAIPDGWCPTVDSLKALNINGVSTELLPIVRFVPKIKIPEQMRYGTSHLKLEHSTLSVYSEKADVVNAQLAAVAEEEAAAVQEAHRLLESCGSLRKALEVWPQLMELLPDWAIKQHQQPTEKRQRAVLTVDTDKLNVALVKGKLAEAASR